MQTYHIRIGPHVHEVSESGGVCVKVNLAIDWAERLPWSHVASYFKRKGAVIVPLMDDTSTVFEFRGSSYEIKKHNGVLRVTKDDEEIHWNELPEQLKGLL